MALPGLIKQRADEIGGGHVGWTEGARLCLCTGMAAVSIRSMSQLSLNAAAVDELIYKPVWPVC